MFLPTLWVLALSALAAGGEHVFETDAQRQPTTRTGGSFVLRGVTIHDAHNPAFVGDLWVENGRIRAIGQVEAPSGLVEIDGQGKHVAPGVIDCHSHMAIQGDVNEGTLSITADVDISDVLDPTDLSIYRALAGGVTTARLLHGSANTIGGRHEVIKLRWRASADALRFRGAPEGIKFALGENPKQSNFGGGGGRRFPDTRMGVEAIFYRAFSRAREYQAEWSAFETARGRGEDLLAPRKDVRLEVLAGILDHTVDVHSHCYRADEVLMLLRAAESYGFRVKTLQHVLEGYKVAREIAAHGAGPSTFGDWWSYKIEAYDAIPQNAALLDRASCVASLNSDSDEMIRRLYLEAAKSVRYAGLDPVRALRLVTLNPAIQLGIDKRVGSIEVGKDADLALMTDEPLSSKAVVTMTFVDGEVQFERRDAFELAARPPAVAPLSEPDRAGALADLPSGGDTIALVGGTLHPVTGPSVENGVLLMRGGRIVALGPDLALPSDARIVDCTGRHVWPGLVALNTPLGLFEIGSVRGTDDLSEIGGNQPDLRVAASLNADSAHIAVTRTNGITRAQSAPQGGGPLMGQSCVIRLAGETWEELLTLDRDMLHLAFPRVANNAKEKKTPEALETLTKQFEAAREHDRASQAAREGSLPAPPFEPRLEALAPFAKGEKKIAVHVDNAQSILYALKWIADQKVQAVLFGVSEGWKVAEQIAGSGLACVVGPVLAMPRSEFDPYDASYANAAVLARAGVPIAIMSDDDENPRNVAFHAAMASAFGLPHEEAVRSITYSAARILGLEAELGSLAVGKRADVIVTEGDLLDLRAPVRGSFIDGVQQDLTNRQTELYQRYQGRLERMQAQR